MEKIKKEDIKIGLLIIDEKSSPHFSSADDKGPGIVSFFDKERGKYKIFFFEQEIETGFLSLDKDYCYGRIINEEEVIDFFEKRLFDQRKMVKDIEEKLFLEKRKLANAEKISSSLPDLIRSILK